MSVLGRVPSIQISSLINQYAWVRRNSLWHFALTPNIGSITRAGDSYLRVLLIHGARSALLAAARKMRRGQQLTTLAIWGLDLAIRSGHNKAAVAKANKIARTLWAMWTRDEDYVPRFASAQ